ncbi:MAG TPA: preprotein translocase subunit YajC [Enhygromyxa sp.]|nr:preprotein translocase subunit YajC [Enhygromyxa sp.]
MLDPTTLLLAEGAASPLGGLLPFILMIGVFYFLVLRPMKKQEDQRKQRLAELKRGDKIVLTGGLLGRISSIDDDVAIVEIAERVKVRVLKKDIADFEENALKKDDKKSDKKDDKKSEKQDDKPTATADEDTDGDSSRKAG